MDRISKKDLLRPSVIIAAINVVYFLVLSLLGDPENAGFMRNFGAMYVPDVVDGKLYMFVSSMFVHFGIEHLANNMLMLVVAGYYVEKELGYLGFVVLYFFSGIIGNIVSFNWYLSRGTYAVSGGASGCVFGLIGCLLMLVIYYRGRFETITLKRIGIMLALSFIYGILAGGIDNAAHIGGLVSGFLISWVLSRWGFNLH